MSQEYYKKLKSESRRLSYLPLANMEHNIIPGLESNNENIPSVLASKRASIISRKRQNIIGTPKLSLVSGAVNKLTRITGSTGSTLPPKVRGTRKSMAFNMNRNIVSHDRNKENEIDLFTDETNQQRQSDRISKVNNIRSSSMHRHSGNSNAIPSNQNYILQDNNTIYTANKDTRPLRDRSFQENIRNDIYLFLNENNFEMETKHLLTDRTLRNPTQKDFMVILTWLFRKIDPGYNISSHIDSDITTFLKIIQYPYLSSITRSQISAAGGQNWHIFLGLLHWLVKCVGLLQNACNHRTSGLDPQASIFVNEDQDEEDPVDVLNDLFLKYVSNAYKLFSMDDDDYSILKKELRSEFDQFSQRIDTSIERANEHFNYLSSKFKELKASFELIESGNKRTRALEGDIIKFKEYISSIEARKVKWQHNLEKLNSEVEKLGKQNLVIEKEYKGIVDKLKNDGFKLVDLENLINDRKFVIQQANTYTNELEDKANKFHASQLFSSKQLDLLKKSINTFNDDIELISNECSSLKFKSSVDLTIQMPNDEEVNINSSYLSVEEFFSKQELQSLMKHKLKSFQNELSEHIFKDKDEIISLQNSIDLLTEKQNEKSEHAASLESSLSSLKIQSEELYNIMNGESKKSKTEIDKLKLQLQSMRSSLETNLLDLDQTIRYKEIEYNNVSTTVKSQRDNLQNEVEKIIDYIIGFKMDIQENLENLGVFVNKEYKSEIRVNESFTFADNSKDFDVDAISSDTNVKESETELEINDTNEATLNTNEDVSKEGS